MATVNGTPGDDTIFSGPGSDEFNLLGGNDKLEAGDGNDTAFGGDGNDTLNGFGGNDTLYGDAGNDDVDGDDGDDTLYGGAGDDIVDGDDGSDLIFGGDGDDTIHGKDPGDPGGSGSADTIFGGAGDDTITTTDQPGNSVEGGDGNDTIFDGAGGNQLYGNNDNDTIFGGAGWDTFFGGDGDDVLVGDSDSYDDFFGGAGNDEIYAGDFDDNWIYGGTGNDTIFAGAGAESIEGNDGDDSIYAGAGDDTVLGGNGNDLIQGQEGNDTLFGGAGADLFELSNIAGTDAIFGGSGATDSDTISFVSIDDVSVNFSDSEDGSYSQAGGATAGTFEDIEIIQTADGDDTLNAGASNVAQTIYSGNGNDTITGGSGDDLIRYGAGDDVVYAGAGNDVTDDSAVSTTGSNTVFGGDGNDLVRGGNGDDRLFGDAGDDTFESDGGNDTLYGGIGNDTLRAYEGNDELFGGADADRLTGGAGNDTLGGGAGTDTFVFDRFGGDDIVTDFDMADDDTDGFTNDQLDVSALRDLGGDPVNVDDVTVEPGAGGFARLRFPEGETVTLQGVSVAQASAPGALYSMGIPCFTAGSLIRTPSGESPIGQLRIGDLVSTRDNGPQPILWIGRVHLGPTELCANPKLRPIHIASGVFGNNSASLVSPQHGIMLPYHGQEQLVRATHLARMRGGKVRRAKGVRGVTYMHLMFEDHQIIWGNGLASESLYLGPCTRNMLGGAQLNELQRLFPELLNGAPKARARAFVPPKQLPCHIKALCPEPSSLRRALNQRNDLLKPHL